MSFIPNWMPQSGSQWQMGAPGLGSPDRLDSLNSSALSFNQGSLATPQIDMTPVDMSGQNSAIATAAKGFNTGDLGLMDYGKLAMGGMQTLGNLYMAFQANKLAKKQFSFQKDFANQNLANSIQSYNTTLEDRIRSRAVTEGRASGYADEYLSKNKLADKRVG